MLKETLADSLSWYFSFLLFCVSIFSEYERMLYALILTNSSWKIFSFLWAERNIPKTVEALSSKPHWDAYRKQKEIPHISGIGERFSQAFPIKRSMKSSNEEGEGTFSTNDRNNEYSGFSTSLHTTSVLFARRNEIRRALFEQFLSR